ncbi:tyrosine-type recombinase/integrase [Bifidobacterium sp. WCA-178-WT-4B]|uniref:tyrosine-type recombinase/integrase n=1 Tax=Bifidobacterium sp. WCA-178-WT-4B TaxID=2605776 RepID=UPI0012B43B76|nr:site-specific integrase [Bifidobacterium sp. WCA-178-WT-4B]MSR97174.1 site-specific integrase [Bifidobacterium sp. WCA-178-WT-4B]
MTTTADRREKGSGGITRLANGKYRAFVETTPDPGDGSRRRVSATGRTKSEALRKARDKALRPDMGMTPGGNATVAEWMDHWVDEVIEPRRAPNTTKSYRTRIRMDITPVIGAVPLDRLRPSHVRMVENRILRGDGRTGTDPRSAATARLTHSILKTALGDAMAEGLIDRNPAALTEVPETEPVEIAILTTGQAARLIALEPDTKWRLIWRLLFITGMRLGETLGITRQELIRSDGLPCLLVEWQLKEFEKDTVIPAGYRARHLGGRMWLPRPKTRKGQRLIPLPADLAADLESYMDSAGIPDDQPVFRSGRGNPICKRGNPICKDTLHHAWRRALDRAGLPHVSIHSARHTAATAFARLGVSGLARQSILGHADVGTTNAIYTHVDAGMLAGAIDGVERLIEG